MAQYTMFSGDVTTPNDVELVSFPHNSTPSCSAPSGVEPHSSTRDNSKRSPMLCSETFQTDSIVWDVGMADWLMYKATPILLVVCSAMLLLTMGTISPPNRTVDCFIPSRFTTSQRLYGEKMCVADNAPIYVPDTDTDYPPTIPPGGLKPGINTPYIQGNVSDFFPIESYPNPPVIFTLILMVVLCLVPHLLWRTGGNREISHYVSITKNKDTTGSLSTTGSLYLYLVTKFMNAVLCGVFVYLIHLVVMEDTTSYVNAYKRYRTHKDVIFMCDYWETETQIRRTFQCIMSANEDVKSLVSTSVNVHTAPLQIASSLRVWVIILLLAHILNCVLVASAYLASLSKWHRMAFMERFPCGYAGKERTLEERETMDQTLGPSGVFTVMLAVRNGYSQHLSQLLNELTVQLQVVADKQR